MKILIIDDSKSMRMLIGLHLQRAGFKGHTIIEAANGALGLEMINTQQPDLVMSDWNMPEMNGFDVAKILKSDDTMKNIPIYLLTNLPEESSSDKAKELGVAGYMMKAMTEPSKLAEEMKNIQNQLKK